MNPYNRIRKQILLSERYGWQIKQYRNRYYRNLKSVRPELGLSLMINMCICSQHSATETQIENAILTVLAALDFETRPGMNCIDMIQSNGVALFAVYFIDTV